MTLVRLAIIGGGVIGKRHAEAIADVPNAKLVAIVDPAASGMALAQAHGVEHYEDAQALFSEGGPDGVIVSTPTELHFPPTLAALEAGAHVLVEKPIMPSVEEAKRIVAKSEETGLHVLVGHHRRYYPKLEKAREIVRSGVLGQLVAVTGHWNVCKNVDYYLPDWRKKREAGPVLTNLIHEMDCLRFMCGDVESIFGEVSNMVMGEEKEDAAALVIRFTNGALGTFVVSDQTASPWAWEFATGETPAFPTSGENTIRLMGTKAALDFPNLVLWHHGDGVADWNHAITREPVDGEMTNAYVSQIAHFCNVISGDENPRITARDATQTLEATLAVFDAARTGQRIVL